jgi:hypothetical protein
VLAFSPVLSPVSSIDEKVPLDIAATSSLFTPVGSQLYNSHIKEVLTTEVSEIGAKFNQVMVLFEEILKGQADNAAEITGLSTQIHSGKIMSQECVIKSDSFERQIHQFLTTEGGDSPSGDHAEVPNSLFDRREKSLNPFHDRFSSLAPNVERDNNFFYHEIHPSMQPFAFTGKAHVSYSSSGLQMELEQ